MLIICATFYGNFSRIVKANDWNVHTYQVIDESRGLVESLVNMETGLRGYALNGKEDMLQPFTLGQKAFMEHLEKAKQLTSDNPVQQDRLARLLQQQQNWTQDFAARLIENRRAVTAGTMPHD
ncbi:MAG: CHASE3 domain-containing protein, partial [Mixta calida]|nr:CHASE3 domain-containing protein [Mixta calida]